MPRTTTAIGSSSASPGKAKQYARLRRVPSTPCRTAGARAGAVSRSDEAPFCTDVRPPPRFDALGIARKCLPGEHDRAAASALSRICCEGRCKGRSGRLSRTNEYDSSTRHSEAITRSTQTCQDPLCRHPRERIGVHYNNSSGRFCGIVSFSRDRSASAD